jgi:hypothetical protein
MDITTKIKELASVDIFKLAEDDDAKLGNPFYLDYYKACLLIPDAYKKKVGGIPQGAFLLAFYDDDVERTEALLLRAIKPTTLPTDDDNVRSMIEYYKDDLKTSGPDSKLDPETKYQFSFSGLECRILGTFYKDSNGAPQFGADVENFYGSHNYSVYKPNGAILQRIVNFRDGEDIPGNPIDIPIGKVRYSSSLRFASNDEDIPVFINPKDFLGKRTALFGMTRTGKSNTVKKIIQATVDISSQAKNKLSEENESNQDLLVSVDDRGYPKFPAGQIIFDINGEYANPNMQDAGTAIYELYKEKVTRYSVIEKPNFEVLKINFFKELEAGMSLISNHFKQLGLNIDYVNAFLSISLEKPEDYNTDFGEKNRYDRKIAAYLCCLYRAGFSVPANFKVKFKGEKSINELVREGNPINPEESISLEDATNWFTRVWKFYNEWDYLKDYPAKNGKEWADEELKALLIFLTQYKNPGEKTFVSGYSKLKPLMPYHTSKSTTSFEVTIIEKLRQGEIVIIDLSQGDTEIQTNYSERICTKIFSDASLRFINNTPNNFIQFYFEEAHNLFPKKDDKDLSQIYNKIAKEGAKLNLGMIYATQEVSSISSNILKNTQNWFIAHLNNEDEVREIKKYYDFGDFADGLIRFSASNDKGFVRMKTYSNPFTVPVQIDKFTAIKE